MEHSSSFRFTLSWPVFRVILCVTAGEDHLSDAVYTVLTLNIVNATEPEKWLCFKLGKGGSFTSGATQIFSSMAVNWYMWAISSSSEVHGFRHRTFYFSKVNSYKNFWYCSLAAELLRKKSKMINRFGSVCVCIHLFTCSCLNCLTMDLSFWHEGRPRLLRM